MPDLKAREYGRFEDIKYVRKNGSEYWSARELADVLDYSQSVSYTHLDVYKRQSERCILRIEK